MPVEGGLVNLRVGAIIQQDGKLLMVRQFRNALERETLEIPAGARDDPKEATALCAARELEEFCEAIKDQPRRPEDLLAHLRTLPLGQWFAGCHEAELAAFLAEL